MGYTLEQCFSILSENPGAYMTPHQIAKRLVRLPGVTDDPLLPNHVSGLLTRHAGENGLEQAALHDEGYIAEPYANTTGEFAIFRLPREV
jgi:hypothetical protein